MMCSFFSLFIKKSYTHNKHESEYLNHILENNKQFVKKTDKSIFEKTATIQTPEAVVISCSDSRVYAEKIFGKEIGDFFVIRTAGHVIGQIALQSVEFALSNLGVKKIIILGHTNCGAVRATINKCSKNHKTSDKNTIIDFILKSYNEVRKNCPTCGEEQIAKKTTEMNIFKTSNFLIQNSALIRKMLKTNELDVYHLLYKVENGEVEDLHFENIISNSENSEKHPLFFAKFLKIKIKIFLFQKNL